VALLFGLFVIPRVLQRWGLPSAVTSFALGALGAVGFGLFLNDPTLHLLSTFGIVALFLFAGLEVDVGELKENAGFLAQHLLVRLLMLGLITWALSQFLGLGPRASALVALAIAIPSTGFILHSLEAFGLDRQEQFWVKSKAIATEILALVLLFVILQSTSATRLGLASLALLLLIAILPPAFKLFAVKVVPFAPKSEYAFLLMMAVVVAYATRQLGVYYLVGAFIVGVAARRFRESLPALASERMLHAVEVFASFFAPFYFFVAGTDMRAEYFSLTALVYGVVLAAVAMPLRLGFLVLHRKLVLKETTARGMRVAVPLLPTLVFTLVLAGILRDQFAVPAEIFGALIVYTILNTVLPGLVIGAPAPVFDAPGLPEPEPHTPDAYALDAQEST
jgi:Kef-type K+ transport system membrane component KefB